MIGIVCALKCEAEKLIQHYYLKPFPQKTYFPLYYSDTIYLIVSGIGKICAAAATSYLHVLTGEGPIFSWLNVGCGGHPFLNIGEGRLAHQIKDASGNQVHYPMFPYHPKIQTETCLTVDRIEYEYPQSVIYEMEASGFYQTAIRFSTAECVHVFKVISDNKNKAPTKDAGKIAELINNHLPTLSDTIETILKLGKDLSDHENASEIYLFLEKWHFTATELHQLKRLIQRLRAYHKDKTIWDERLLACKKGKEVLSYLNQKIEVCSLSFT